MAPQKLAFSRAGTTSPSPAGRYVLGEHVLRAFLRLLHKDALARGDYGTSRPYCIARTRAPHFLLRFLGLFFSVSEGGKT